MATWINPYQVWLTEAQSLSNTANIFSYFKVAGTDWTDESLAAMCGNIGIESSVNPNMYEYGYAWEDNRGFGLVGWTPRSKYWNWAVNLGYTEAEIRSGDVQLQRIQYEIDNNIQWQMNYDYTQTFAEFRANSGGWSLDELTEMFCWCYENPLYSAGVSSMPRRKAFAHLVYNTYGGGQVQPPSGKIKKRYIHVSRKTF